MHFSGWNCIPFLLSFCSLRLVSLYWSVFFLHGCCFIFLKYLFLLVMRDFISLFTQGSLHLELFIIFVGIDWFIISKTFSLKLFHSWSTVKSCSFNCFSMSMLLSFSFISSVFTLFYWYTFLGGLFIFLGLILASTYTISWSDIPGIISTLLISELLLVKNTNSCCIITNIQIASQNILHSIDPLSALFLDMTLFI